MAGENPNFQNTDPPTVLVHRFPNLRLPSWKPLIHPISPPRPHHFPTHLSRSPPLHSRPPLYRPRTCNSRDPQSPPFSTNHCGI
ncbi:hypothetical protein OIU74_014632 [Salix koriyanagi]|uniref:Uncharacterized protein n=1 Tax=Salix koriyanagi TaxID=2511006 RepID=A0A9Q0PX08_9ROSI|nr:hypothetical protein OIU74_014632 [Salix koriyanagi]